MLSKLKTLLQLKCPPTVHFCQHRFQFMLKVRTRFSRTWWIFLILYCTWNSPKCLSWLILYYPIKDWIIVLWSYMISAHPVFLNIFDIARFSFYSVNVTALSVNVIYFTFLVNLYWDLWNPYDLLDIPRVLIHGIYWATIAGILPYLNFCMLVSIKIIYFHSGMRFWCHTSTKYLRIIVFVPSIPRRKEICITFILYITLEYWRNNIFFSHIISLKVILITPQEEPVL